MCAEKLKIPKRTFKDKIKRLKEVITVEPLIACYQMALFVSKPALDNLEFEKACKVNLSYDSDICKAILSGNYSQHKSENEEVQRVISTMHSWQQPVQSFTPLILVLFLGSFSDRHKWRKPFLLMPLVGELFGVVGCIMCTIFMTQLPLEIQGISQKIIPSLLGGQTMLVMATTAYIADISSVKMRTLRLGVVQIVISVVLPTVQSFSGILFVKAGYLSVLTVSAVLHFTALLYGALWIKETQKDRSKKFEWCVLVDMFDPEHAKETFKLLLRKKGEENDRLLVWLLVLMAFLQRAAFDGESNVLFLYTQNVFQWTPLEYSYFLTVNSLVALGGHLFGVPLFTKVFHFSDSIILLIAIANKIVTNIFFGLAETPQLFYAGVAVSAVTRMYRTAKKSLATKIVAKNDVGKAQSLLGICDVLAPAAFVPIYNKIIYFKTLNTFPATFFFFSIFLYGVCACFVVAIYIRIFGKKDISIVPPHPENPTIFNEKVIETIHL
ncbi:probable peptidoglycan muropeptide transporter SLC46 isoform X2 [Euwallacea fornicatus]|uniref:probable peptidoglycan muropeptide transporter SLC46 isoform X2 n=1 Tax=Euwallacea fornicatus TaxID=995702 RepID=UPI00338FF269